MRALVVTLAVEDAAQERWDELRRQYFPPERLVVGAHLTLFHAVPGMQQPFVKADLADVAGPRFHVHVAGVRSLGRGAALDVVCPHLEEAHRELQHRWRHQLTSQDRQRLRPHVTLQNKVDPSVARQTVEELAAGFTPYDVEAVGYDLWRYDGGPWTHLWRAELS